MWVNKTLLETVLADNKKMADDILYARGEFEKLRATNAELRTQKAKDDLSIDWLRHRVNALEKEKSILLAKVAGVHFPTPEIVPTRPGTISESPSFDSMPSFEDIGDSEAGRLGVAHDPEGVLVYTK